MSLELPTWVGRAAIWVVGAFAVGWVAWLSNSVVNLTASAAKNETLIQAVHSELGGRLDRISARLPTEIALHSKEILWRSIRSAVIVTEPVQINANWYRTILVYDGIRAAMVSGKIQLDDQNDTHSFLKAIWYANISTENSVMFQDAEIYGTKYSATFRPMPAFIDKRHSSITNDDASDLIDTLSKLPIWKPDQEDSVPRNANYSILAAVIEDNQDRISR